MPSNRIYEQTTYHIRAPHSEYLRDVAKGKNRNPFTHLNPSQLANFNRLCERWVSNGH
jgi:hypothetical protein